MLCTPTRINFITAATNSTLTRRPAMEHCRPILKSELVGGGGGGAGSGSPQAAATVGSHPAGKHPARPARRLIFRPAAVAAGVHGSTQRITGGAASAVCDIGHYRRHRHGSTVPDAVNLARRLWRQGSMAVAALVVRLQGAVAGNAAAANSGSGGGGGGGSAASIINSGAGGGAGAYCLKMLTPSNILSTYFVTVGDWWQCRWCWYQWRCRRCRRKWLYQIKARLAMTWRVAKSLDVLLGQINAKFPDRDKSSDGGIGDEAHAYARQRS